MNFLRPQLLWLLLAWPMLGLWMRRAWRKSVEVRRTLGIIRTPTVGWRFGWWAVWGLAVVAASGPGFGRDSAPDGPGRDVVLLFDLSRSMGARDAFPSRLGAAVDAANSLVGALGRSQGDRVAVVGFAGRGAIRCPLTSNLGAAVEAIRALRPGTLQPSGTDLGAGLLTAKDCFDDQEHAGGRTIVVFTDGEDFAETWPAAAEELKRAGIVVHAAALGDPEQGAPVPDSEGLTGAAAPTTRRRDSALETVAQTTGGTVVRLGLAATDLGRLYRERIEPTAARIRRKSMERRERAEHPEAFLIAALLLAGWSSWPGRLTWGRGRSWRVALVALALPAIGADSHEPDLRRLRAEGFRAFRQDRPIDAHRAFERALSLGPTPDAEHDLAASLFRLGRFEEARDHYHAALAGAGPGLRLRVEYALGNCSLALGQVADAIQHYETSLAVAVPKDPTSVRLRADAVANLAFARQLPEPPVPVAQPPDAGRSAPSPSKDDGANPDMTPPVEGNRPPNVRGQGGQGGTGNAERPPATPAEQLRDALDAVKQAREGRLRDTAPTSSSDRSGRPDW